jgi:hypothetical protein
MADEMQQVLDMLAGGTITTEQAAELLDALRDEPVAPVPVMTAGRSERRRRRDRSERPSLRPEIAQLVEAANFGVDEELIQSLRRAGYTGLSASDLVELAKFGVDEDFIEGLRRVGYTNLSVDELVEMAKFGADADFIEEMRRVGFTDLTPGELAHMAMVGVNPDTVAALRSLGTEPAEETEERDDER